MAKWDNVTVVEHPLIQERLTLARDRHTGVAQFRKLLEQIATLMAFEITRDYPTIAVEVETPLGPCQGVRLAQRITVVPILRAGLGMADGVLQIIPEARVGHCGAYRDIESLTPVVYYKKLPPDIARTDVIIVDPMLATGGSICEVVSTVREARAERIKILCLVASPEGIAAVNRGHPEVRIYTAAVDDRLNQKGYIIPGLGDAGDRLYGTA